MDAVSRFTAQVRWQRAGQAFTDNRYSRAHAWHFDGGLSVPASSSPLSVPLPLSDAGALDPEEALVAAASSCHMLFFLSLAAGRGLTVDAYVDDAVGTLGTDSAGRKAMTRIALRPVIVFGGRQPLDAELDELHHLAHERCYIANSLKTEVIVERGTKMYKMAGCEEKRESALFDLMRANTLGTVCLNGDAGLAAYHVPFEICASTAEAPFGVLRGHVARANPLWRQADRPALVVFNGPSAYITPALYEEKAVHGKVVPTYDYAIAHAHGTLRAIDDPDWMFAFLERLTLQYEGERAAPWQVKDAPRDFIDKLMTHLVGIEIVIERLEGMTKMSQNQPPRNRANIAEAIPAIAALVRSAVRS